MLPTELSTPPAGVLEALSLVAGVDAALLAGFARLGPAHKDGLERLARGLAGSPLGPAVADAVAAVRAGPPLEAHLLALAAGREALLGAAHDALLAQALAVAGYAPQPAPPATERVAPPEAMVGLLQSARQWLCELALGGLLQADPASVSPILTTLERLQESPELTRVSALLTGLYDEWMDLLPLGTPDEAPGPRWADLWSRALLGATGVVDRPTAIPGKGRYSCFGLELRHHPHVVSAALWGLWEPSEGPPRVARATLSGWRVPALAGAEGWHALAGAYGPLLTAIADRKSWEATASVSSSGDIRLGRGAPGPSADPLEVAAKALVAGAALPALPGADRHPAQIAVPLLCTAKPGKDGMALRDGVVPVRLDRLSAIQGVDAAGLAGCERWMGLLRWDRGWHITPLGGRNTSGKKPVDLGPLDAMGAEVKSTSASLSTLKQFAGKLLRAKS